MVGCGSGEAELDVSATGDSASKDAETVVDTVHAPVAHDTVVQPTVVAPEHSDTPVAVAKPPMDRPVVSPADQQRIDAWLTAYADSLNDYGDPEGTMYAGGTPLFNENSGKPVSKYEYIVAKHQERPWDKPLPTKK